MTVVETQSRLRLQGAVVRPGEPGWDEARSAFNLTVDQTPDLIALPESERDTIEVVNFARRHGFRVAAQRTGHNADPLGPLEGTILLRTDRLQGVQIDAVRRIARVRGGTKWADVVPQASELGLAAPHGSTPDVSVAGYTLGGGVGWYARKLGLAASHVLAIELVTADGELVRVDADHEPELFWALRGGGGSFGIVTALELELQPLPEVFAGALFFPLERAGEVLHAWRRWVETVPEELTSVGRVLRFPPLPDIPEPMRGKAFSLVEAVFMGSEREGRELIEPLVALGPQRNTFAMVPPAGIAELHMDPPHPVPYFGRHQLLSDLTPEAIDRLVSVTGAGSGSPLVSYEVRHLGGELARGGEGKGALASIRDPFITFGVGAVMDEQMGIGVSNWLDLIDRTLAPWDSGRRYLNFTEARVDVSTFFAPGVWERLRAVKGEVDPDNLFRANHPIEA